MITIPQYTIWKLLIVVLLSLFACACQPGTTSGEVGFNSIDSTPVPSPTASPTLTPTVSPLEARMTELGDIQVLCVIPEKSSSADLVRAILANYGYQVVTQEEGCEALVRVKTQVEALAGNYKNSKGGGTSTCYTGARVTTTVTLEIDGIERASATDERTKRPVSGTISSCPTKAQAPAHDLWSKAILNNVVEVFGPMPLLAAIRDELPGVDLLDASSAVLIYTDKSAAYAVPELIEALQDEKVEVREAAVKALRKIGPAGVEATSMLIRLLADADEGVQAQAAEALGVVAADQIQAIPPLIEALQSSEKKLQFAAVEAIGEFGPAAKDAVPYLLNWLGGENQLQRRKAAISIAKIGGDGIDQALPVLIENINNEEVNFYRPDIYLALKALGPEAMPAVPALIEAIGYEKSYYQDELQETLVKITGMYLSGQQAWQDWWDSRE
jgi:HEAT repeat protein